jgi:hypothetical protein
MGATVADEMVRRAQLFVNEVYGSRIGMTVEVDGRTGWDTMRLMQNVV